MPGQITVDEKNETASIQWLDDKGDTDAAAPANAVVTWGTDNPAVITIDTASGKVTPVAEGTGNVTATIADSTGAPVMEPDGTTPFPNPTPQQVTVGPGAAVGDALTLSV